MPNAIRITNEKSGVKGSWSSITTQIGMSSYKGLTVNQSETMVKKHNDYMNKDALFGFQVFVTFPFKSCGTMVHKLQGNESL